MQITHKHKLNTLFTEQLGIVREETQLRSVISLTLPLPISVCPRFVGAAVAVVVAVEILLLV